jgi:hypothetical protein
LPFFKDIRCLEQVAGPLRVGHCRPIIRKSAPSADPFTIDKHFMAICTHSLPSFWYNLTTICLCLSADFVIFAIGHLNFLTTNTGGVNYKKSNSHMLKVICVDF